MQNCPLEKVKNEDACWYYSAPVGRNRLSKMVPAMCQLAEINRSLRATGATALYTAGVLEKIIQERTGHRSVESACACMNILAINSNMQFQIFSLLPLSSTTNQK